MDECRESDSYILPNYRGGDRTTYASRTGTHGGGRRGKRAGQGEGGGANQGPDAAPGYPVGSGDYCITDFEHHDNSDWTALSIVLIFVTLQSRYQCVLLMISATNGWCNSRARLLVRRLHARVSPLAWLTLTGSIALVVQMLFADPLIELSQRGDGLVGQGIPVLMLRT
jgi:hypothetical protein